jgi:hypothetical protein
MSEWRLSHLGGNLAGLDLRQAGKAGIGLLAHDATTEVTLDLQNEKDAHQAQAYLLEALGVVGVDGLDELVQGSLILLLDIRKSDGGGGLLVDEGAKASLALLKVRDGTGTETNLDNGVGNLHLAAERGEPNDELWKMHSIQKFRVVIERKNKLSTLFADDTRSKATPKAY